MTDLCSLNAYFYLPVLYLSGINLSNDAKITSLHYIFLQQLKYYTQIHVRSTRGKNAKGSKITGVEPLPGEDKERERDR